MVVYAHTPTYTHQRAKARTPEPQRNLPSSLSSASSMCHRKSCILLSIFGARFWVLLKEMENRLSTNWKISSFQAISFQRKAERDLKSTFSMNWQKSTFQAVSFWGFLFQCFALKIIRDLLKFSSQGRRSKSIYPSPARNR